MVAVAMANRGVTGLGQELLDSGLQNDAVNIPDEDRFVSLYTESLKFAFVRANASLCTHP
jgi:hypothetical protein